MEAVSLSGSKNPALVEAGHRGARRRWGPPRIARLDDLTVEQRRLILALIEAAKSEAVTDVTPVTAHAEGQANDRAAT
jgi:hypothetical protein